MGAPAKTLQFLTSDSFPLSPESCVESSRTSVLDLGTGNGSVLFSLRLEGGYNGPMVGIDYSSQSIDLAKKLWKQYSATSALNSEDQSNDVNDMEAGDIQFEVVDLIRDDPTQLPWWPRDSGGFDLVLDKGTFDAISLSSETMNDQHGRERRICEAYPEKVARMVKHGGYLLITSCNWTQEEVLKWFTEGTTVEGLFEVHKTLKYPVFEFGGQKGQGVASVCFQRTMKA